MLLAVRADVFGRQTLIVRHGVQAREDPILNGGALFALFLRLYDLLGLRGAEEETTTHDNYHSQHKEDDSRKEGIDNRLILCESKR